MRSTAHVSNIVILSSVMQVLNVWQSAMAIVRTFPHPPEALATVVDALAQQSGDPGAASFDTAAETYSVAQEMADVWPSVENLVYKEKMAGLQVQHRTAVASQ